MTFMFRVFVTIEKEGEEESEVEVARVTGNVRLGPGWTSSRPQSGSLGAASPSLCAVPAPAAGPDLRALARRSEAVGSCWLWHWLRPGWEEGLARPAVALRPGADRGPASHRPVSSRWPGARDRWPHASL